MADENIESTLLPEEIDAELEYIIPNRAVPLKIVESAPINENWEKIEEAINRNYELATKVDNKLDTDDLGVSGGVATLDVNTKLVLSQLPEQAKGHVYEVRSLEEQLALTAYPGDICVRQDIGKTFCLKVDAPSLFSNWVEIASTAIAADILGNPCYSTNIYVDQWQENKATNNYYFIFDSSEHNQGNTEHLIVIVKNDYNQNINCDYVVSDLGVVTVYSDIPFNGSVTISNLRGNSKNTKFVPYAVISGYKQDGVPRYLTHSMHTINLNTLPYLNIVDGFDISHTITFNTEKTIPTDIANGEYIVFIDTANIDDHGALDDLTYIPTSQYLGVVTDLPEDRQNGQRCYVTYDKSYECIKGSWAQKAFVPIGEFITKDGIIVKSVSYPFMTNGVDVKFNGHELDRLYGPEIHGLSVSIDNYLQATPGSCLVNNKLVQSTDTIVKDFTKYWAEGNTNGALDTNNNELSETVYEVVKSSQVYYTNVPGEINSYLQAEQDVYLDEALEQLHTQASHNEYLYNGKSHLKVTPNFGWGNIFLITAKTTNNIDIVMSFNEKPTLPIGYDIYRKIGYFYRDENNNVSKIKQIKDKIYFVEPITITSTTNKIIELPLPLQEAEVIINVKLNELQSVAFMYDNIKVDETYNKNYTTTIPYTDSKIRLVTDVDNAVTLQLLGYVDERKLV